MSLSRSQSGRGCTTNLRLERGCLSPIQITYLSGSGRLPLFLSALRAMNSALPAQVAALAGRSPGQRIPFRVRTFQQPDAPAVQRVWVAGLPQTYQSLDPDTKRRYKRFFDALAVLATSEC